MVSKEENYDRQKPENNGIVSDSDRCFSHRDDQDKRSFSNTSMDSGILAQVFYARIQKETEEFLQQVEIHNQSFRKSTAQMPQSSNDKDDEAFSKMKYLLMIHTTCSHITNLLVNSESE